MGILKVGSLQMRDSDGMDVALQDNLETFRIEPATQQRPTPRLSLRSRSGNLVASLGEDQAGLEQFHFDVSALRYTPRTPNTGQLNHLLDSLQRVYPAIPRDSLLRHARMERLQKEREQTWADKDVNISISHTPQLVVLACNKNQVVGIDAEQCDRQQVLRVRDKFLNANEKQFICPDDLPSHVLAWTAKEAIIKAERDSALDWTDGICLEPFDIRDDETLVTARCAGRRYSLVSRILEGHRVTVATLAVV